VPGVYRILCCLPLLVSFVHLVSPSLFFSEGIYMKINIFRFQLYMRCCVFFFFLPLTEHRELPHLLGFLSIYLPLFSPDLFHAWLHCVWLNWSELADWLGFLYVLYMLWPELAFSQKGAWSRQTTDDSRHPIRACLLFKFMHSQMVNGNPIWIRLKCNHWNHYELTPWGAVLDWMILLWAFFLYDMQIVC